MTYNRAAIWMGVLAIGSAARAGTSTYLFTLDPQGSGLSADVDLSVAATGDLIGNYHATDNPTGTRTKPGAFGSFGDTENVPVPATFAPAVSGSPDTAASGSFTMIVDVAGGAVQVGGLTTNLLAGGPTSLATSVTVAFGSFRTRAPSSLYFGATLPVPLGDATLTVLTAAQVGDPVAGVLMPVGPDTYSVSVAVPVELTGTGDFLGNPIDLPPTPIIFAISGELTLSGDTAVLTSSVPVEIDETGPPTPDGPAVLPPIPFDVPTIIPPGGTAHLLANLTVNTITVSMMGTLSTIASGERQVVVETGACCYAGACTEKLPAECVPFVCNVADHLPATFAGCYGDADGNGFVNAGDRGFVAVNIGSADPVHQCLYDMDGNGFINAGDRGFIAVNIGLCTALPDYMNGSGLNDGQPETRFGAATFMGVGSECGTVACP